MQELQELGQALYQGQPPGCTDRVSLYRLFAPAGPSQAAFDELPDTAANHERATDHCVGSRACARRIRYDDNRRNIPGTSASSQARNGAT